MPKILVLGYTGSGKTTAAKMLAEMMHGSPPRNCSDYIIEDYAKEQNKSAAHILANKNDFRKELFEFGLKKQAEDPAYPVSEAIKHTDVVTGVRTHENLEACKDMFDLVLWIDRGDSGPGSSDKLGPNDADRVIDNNGDFKQLDENLSMALISEMI